MENDWYSVSNEFIELASDLVGLDGWLSSRKSNSSTLSRYSIVLRRDSFVK